MESDMAECMHCQTTTRLRAAMRRVWLWRMSRASVIQSPSSTPCTAGPRNSNCSGGVSRAIDLHANDHVEEEREEHVAPGRHLQPQRRPQRHTALDRHMLAWDFDCEVSMCELIQGSREENLWIVEE